MRFCERSVARADQPIQCPADALEVTGLDIDDVPHTVRNNDRGRFTADITNPTTSGLVRR